MRDSDDFYKDVSLVQDLVDAMAGFRRSQNTCIIEDVRKWRPPADMYETDAALFIIMEVAGMCVEDFHIILKGRKLFVSGERSEYSVMDKTQYHSWEIDTGDFKRAFCIPGNIDTEGIKAEYQYENGYLIIKLPKKKLSRDIPVE